MEPVTDPSGHQEAGGVHEDGQAQEQGQQQQQPAGAEVQAAAGGADEQQQQQAPPDGASAGAPLPLPYVLDADGRRQPLPGARSIFLRGATAQAFGLDALTAIDGETTTASVPREKLLADIQFQGAISDWHPLKEALKAADYDPLLVRANPDDAYCDGGNYEVALTAAAAQAWLEADAAAAAAAVAAAQAEAQAANADAGGGAVRRSRQRRPPRPWQDLGSEAELAAAGVPSTTTISSSSNGPEQQQPERPSAVTSSSGRQPPTGLLFSRPRHAFGAPVALSDAAASDLWSSTTSEARPFKDAGYDLTRARLERPVQAVPRLQEAAVQATGGWPRNRCCQTSPRSLPPETLEGLMAAPAFTAFLEAVRPRMEEALLQNSLADILSADLDLLGADEAEGLGSSTGASGAAAAGGSSGSSAGGKHGSAHAAERGGLTEAQSFTDLAYSKNKVVSAICWVPGRKGVVAAACTDPASQAQRLATLGRLAPAFILVWNFRDPIHPEYVLESPHEVTAFGYNPVNPDIIVAGAYNGQLVVWDTSGTPAAAAAAAATTMAAGGGSGGKGGRRGPSVAAALDDCGEHEAVTPVIRHKYLSSVEHSHTVAVCDLCWLPGMEVDRAGRVFPIRANSAGTSAQSLLRSMTLGASAVAAAAAGSNVPREACFVASLAPDGKVMFWDVRLDKLLRKGTKRLDESEVVWRPMHVVHLLSVAGNDFAGCRFSFDPHRLDSGAFIAGSLEGELLAGNFVRPPGDDNPDYTRVVFAPHAGPIVALAVSPFLPQLLLSVGDWSFRLWWGGLESSRVPLFVSPYASEAYTAASWSPTRPGLLFLATAGGSLQVWDLLDRSHEPSLAVTAASAAITSISFSNAQPKHHTHPAVEGEQHGGAGAGSTATSGQRKAAQAGSGLQVLALGDAAGVLHLFELPRSLRRPLAHEGQLMDAFVAREAARLADVAGRQGLRAAALAEAKRAEEGRRTAPAGGEDSGSVADQGASQQQQQQRQSVLGSTGDGGGGTLVGTAPVKSASVADAAKGPAGALSGAEAVEAARAEAAYSQLEADVREQLGLA